MTEPAVLASERLKRRRRTKPLETGELAAVVDLRIAAAHLRLVKAILKDATPNPGPRPELGRD